MNSASTKTRPDELNRDATTPLATRICDDVGADNRLRPAVEGMRRSRLISQLARNFYHRYSGPPAGFEHVASEIRHGKR